MHKYLIFISGFLFGLAGWTIEFFPNQQFIVRTILVCLSLVLLSFCINFKVNNNDLRSLYYFLMYLLFLTLSIFVNEDSIQFIIREVLLIIVIFYIMTLINDFYKFKIFMIGLVISSTTLIFYYFINIDFSHFFVSYYRLNTGLGPTGIGTISLILAIIYFDLIMKNENKKLYIFLLIILILMSIIIMLATKSRTAIILFSMAIILYLFLENRKKYLLILLVTGATISVFNYEKIEIILRITPTVGYSGDKSITNLTGRTDIWQEGFNLFQGSPLVGVGPSSATVIADEHEAKLHNAYLQIIVSYGMLGFIPILILIMRALLTFFKSNLSLFKVIFVVGILGGFVESRLFNFGSPGNFIFLLSFIYLLQSNSLKVKGMWK